MLKISENTCSVFLYQCIYVYIYYTHIYKVILIPESNSGLVDIKVRLYIDKTLAGYSACH